MLNGLRPSCDWADPVVTGLYAYLTQVYHKTYWGYRIETGLNNSLLQPLLEPLRRTYSTLLYST